MTFNGVRPYVKSKDIFFDQQARMAEIEQTHEVEIDPKGNVSVLRNLREVDGLRIDRLEEN